MRTTAAIAALVSLLAACHSGGGAGDDVCAIRYELVAGQPSQRVDRIWVADDGRSVARSVDTGGDGVPDEAIYLWFDGSGDPLVEALDIGADGAIEARSDAQPRIADVITPFVVDLDTLSDGVDLLQLSIDLPSSTIGPWNPTRITYQLPCDQGAAAVVSTGEGRDRIGLDADGDGDPETVLNIERGEDGALRGWTVDTDGDGEPNDTATLVYNDRSQIREVYWTRPGFFLGDTYVQSRFIYDTSGHLYRWDSDSDGDGLLDTRIVYGAACFAGAP